MTGLMNTIGSSSGDSGSSSSGAMAATIAVSLMLRLDFGGVLWIFAGIAARRAMDLGQTSSPPAPLRVASLSVRRP
jgi:hypothetical protein